MRPAPRATWPPRIWPTRCRAWASRPAWTSRRSGAPAKWPKPSWAASCPARCTRPASARWRRAQTSQPGLAGRHHDAAALGGEGRTEALVAEAIAAPIAGAWIRVVAATPDRAGERVARHERIGRCHGVAREGRVGRDEGIVVGARRVLVGRGVSRTARVSAATGILGRRARRATERRHEGERDRERRLGRDHAPRPRTHHQPRPHSHHVGLPSARGRREHPFGVRAPRAPSRFRRGVEDELKSPGARPWAASCRESAA
jgi:hypothetical protein